MKSTIQLRPRFSKTLIKTPDQILKSFEKAKSNTFNHKVSISDNHVFLRIDRGKQHFWSPQLHLEIREDETANEIHGLFGPNPTVWTMFMFLHFVVGTLFIGTSIWGYTLLRTNNDFTIPIIINLLLIAIWFGFYIAGRIGKRKAHDQMHDLYSFYNSIIESKD